jgi:hypothetical protein
MCFDPILIFMLALRALFALATVVLAALLLRQGLPLGAVAVIAAAILVRGSAESGRLHRLAARAARAS